MTLVGADLLKQLGFNVDLASVDQGTLQQRRASQAVPGAGGWSVFLSGISGTNGFDPATNFALRGNGKQAWIGWPTSPRLEALRQDWLDAPDLAAQKAVCRQVQSQAFEDVPYVPLGDYY